MLIDGNMSNLQLVLGNDFYYPGFSLPEEKLKFGAPEAGGDLHSGDS